MMMNKEILEKFVEKTKAQVVDNMKLVEQEGNCPCDRMDEN